MEEIRVVADDWFFVRILNHHAVAFSSEKNFYTRADIATIWKEFQWLVEKATFDKQGRAISNIRWVVGKGRIVPMTTIKKIIILKRDPEDKTIVKRLTADGATQYLEENGFCNPHLLIRDDRKTRLRRQFFKEMCERSSVYLVNTIQPPLKTHEFIKQIIHKG